MGFRLKRVGRALVEASWGGHISQRVERASEWAGRALAAAVKILKVSIYSLS